MSAMFIPGVSVLAVALAATACGSNSDTSNGNGSSGGSSGSGGGSSGSGGTAATGFGGSSTSGSGGSSGSSGAPSNALCGEVPGGDPSQVHVLRFESEEPALTVQLKRRFVESGAGESAIYDLDAFALILDGETHCVDSADALEYTNSHHNWQDVAMATLDRVRYEIAISYEFEDGWKPTLASFDANGAVVLEKTALIPTGGPVQCYNCPNFLPVWISEVMVNNAAAHADEHGDFDPWIELFNPSSDDIDLSGWTLSNDLSERTLWSLPNVTLARGEYLVVFADAEEDQGELHAQFRLPSEAGAVILTDPRGVTAGGHSYGSQAVDSSFGLTFMDAGYVSLPEPTPGTANPGMQE